LSGFGTSLHHVKLREGSPGCPLGTPKNLGFSRVPGPAFQGFGHLSHPSLRAILGGFRDPQNMVFQAHPGSLEFKNNGLSRPLFGILPRPT